MSDEQERQEQERYDVIVRALPQPPADATFTLERVVKLSVPHPYMIGVRHVVHASDYFSGMLGKEAIESAERSGATCEICKGRVPFAEHVSQVTAVIRLAASTDDLNAVPGLHAYLLAIKDQATALGVDGFAFPGPDQRV